MCRTVPRTYPSNVCLLLSCCVCCAAKNTPSVKTFVEEFDITDPRGKQPRSVTSFGYRLTDPERALQVGLGVPGLQEQAPVARGTAGP